MADLMRWHIVDTKAEFNLGVPIDNDMYFINETKEIYKGANLYSSPVGLYTTALPTAPATNRLYIHTTDLEGKIHDGNNWITVIRPVENVVDDASANPASGAAIASYVSSAIAAGLASVNVIKRVTYSGNTRVMSFVHGNDTLTDITMSGLGMSLSYEQASGKLQLLDVTGAKIGDPVNIDLARVVYDAEYDATRKVLILYFDQAKTKYVEIPVGDIIKQVEVTNMCYSPDNYMGVNYLVTTHGVQGGMSGTGVFDMNGNLVGAVSYHYRDINRQYTDHYSRVDHIADLYARKDELN